MGAYSARPPAGYDLYTFSKTGRPIPGDGLAILIQQGIPHAPLTSDLQAFAFRIQAPKLYSVCTIYVPPNARHSGSTYESSCAVASTFCTCWGFQRATPAVGRYIE